MGNDWSGKVEAATSCLRVCDGEPASDGQAFCWEFGHCVIHVMSLSDRFNEWQFDNDDKNSR